MTTLESFTGGRSIAVDFTAIERELAGLWKAAADTGENAGPAVMRACQLNLMVLCLDAAETARAIDRVATVARARPSRVLMASVDPGDSGDRLDAAITALCSFTPGAGKGRQVCCEQISVTASLHAARRLPGAVLPLLLPDLPVVLWRPGDPAPPGRSGGDPAGEIESKLVDAADRVVVDSVRLADGEAGLGRLSDLGRPITDLAWLRLAGWRDLTARLFDAPAAQGRAASIERITVLHAAGRDEAETAAGRAQAMLLACWAASRLRWEPAPVRSRPGGEEDTARFDLWRPDGEAGVMAIAPSDTTSLALEAPEASFLVRHDAATRRLETEVRLPSGAPCPSGARAGADDEAALLCRALENGARDAAYEAALRLASRLLAVRSWGRPS